MDCADVEQWRGKEVARLLALFDNERRTNQEIIASAPVGFAVVAPDGQILSTNRSFRRLLTLTREEVRLSSLHEIVPSTPLASALAQAAAGETRTGQIQVEVKGHSLQMTAQPLRSWPDNGEFNVLLVVQEAATPVRAALEGGLFEVPAVLWSLDPKSFQFTSVAGPVTELLGYPKDHWLTPHFWSDRADTMDRAALKRFYEDALRADGTYSCEFRAATAAGKLVWCRDSFRVARDPDSGRIRVNGITIDITSRRRSEEDSAQAQRIEAIVGLSRQLTHDLNNALMIVTGYAEELLSYFDDEDPHRADVQAILTAAETMAGITGELHGFTRKQASKPVETDIVDALRAAAIRIREDLGAVLVARALEPKLVAMADPVQLEALMVAIARALRHKSDPHMIITAAKAEIAELTNLAGALSPGKYVEITFRGPLGSELPVHLVEALVSGRNPHHSEMARAYAVIREWGGSVRIAHSEHAAEVHVLLVAPREIEQPRPVPEPTPVPEPEPLPPVRSSGSVLVVEDEGGIRALIRKVLQREGYQVFEAANSEEAAEITRHRPCGIGLLITDLRLASEDGRALAQRLLTDCPDMKVLYISGYTGATDVAGEDLEPGASFLRKPFTLGSLLKKVKAAFSGGPPVCGVPDNPA